ncbi:hypothetical protein INT48_001944 [Thamnidium elegans]|uniref:Uncharacterized protein n=1 Tax=Thamnidium elegans TaxID=101142 RepID=A0A8H7STI1_9FUNG|nr:hypothetical protein INT48_001944 [Thamnidium elegans]
MSTEFDLYDYIISIDIGTTFSGSCFSYVKDEKNIVHVIKWPEQKPDDTFEKTPTACLYSKPDHTLLKWGKSAIDHVTAAPNDPDVLLIDQFKLKLHTIFQRYRTNNSQLTLEEKRYWNAAVDYLREIYQYTCHQLIQTVLPQIASEKDFRFVLTVPATWVTEDIACMRLIAIEAGLIRALSPNERLVIINEAFAASLFCEREFCIKTEGHTKKLVKGQRYLVCDAGGGTVDLATYECTDTSVEQKGHCQLALESGGCCGSTILDQNMENYLRDQVFLGGVSDSTLKLLVNQFIKEIKHYFGGETGRNNYISPTSTTTAAKQTELSDDATTLTTTGDTVMKDVQENDYNYEEDYLNHSDNEQEEMEQDESCYDEDDVYMDQDIFSDDDFVQDLSPTDYVYFTLPPHDESIIPSVMESLHTTGNIVRHAETTQLRIKNADISKFVFDPVVENVMSLVRKQIRKSHTTIETLFLLGGFGQSPYLYKKLHYEFITCTNAIQHLIVPEDGYRASMRGGIYHGIDCIDIIPKVPVKSKMFQYSRDMLFGGKRDLLVGIDIDLFDLTATFSFLKLKGRTFLRPNGTFKELINNKNLKKRYGFFRKFQFDSETFLQYNFNHIVDAACEDGTLLEFWANQGDTLYYKCLINAFIHQLYEFIQNDYETLYPEKQWQVDNVRYCISIAPHATNNPDKEDFNIFINTPMTTLKQEILKKMTELDQVFSPGKVTNAHKSVCRLFDSKATFSSEEEKDVLKAQVFSSASEIGMVKGADIYQGSIVWVGLSNTYRINYPYFDIIGGDITRKEMCRGIQEDEKIQILTLDLKLFSRQEPVTTNIRPLKSTVGPSIPWEFQSLLPAKIGKMISVGNYTAEKLLMHLAGMIDFMGPHVRDYISRNVIPSGPFATHTLGDLFLIPGTDDLIYMKLPLSSTVNKAGLLYAMKQFKDYKIITKQIHDVLIRPWIKYRLAYMIKNACETYITSQSEMLCLFFTGDSINFDILKPALKNLFDEKIYFSFNSDVDFTRHVACLAHGNNTIVLQKATRVTEQRYAVHILSHDIKRQENMAQHMYKIFYTAQEGALTLLHPLIGLNVPVSSIIPNHNFLLQLKVPHECSVAIVLYASGEVEPLDNSISNNNFKKLHRFIFPIKDVTKAIQITCKVERYALVFTVKQDDYEADYRCIDFLEVI